MVLKKRRIAAWVIVSLVSAIFSARALADDLAGRVTDSAGKPLAGATVLVSTAAPRVGVSVYCPSCYADCGKQATADADGKFTIRDLDPSLVFYLVAAAEDYRAGNSGRVDPSRDKAAFKLSPLPANLPPEQTVRGRVVDRDGKPVVGAVVSPIGCQQGDRRWWGSLPGVDSFSITNQAGEFLITASEPADAFDLQVKSPRHAAQRFPLVSTGDTIHELAVEIGSFVRGQVIAGGKPVTDVLLGLVQTDRSSESFLGEQQIGTRADGSFEFSYVPDADHYYLYTKMTSPSQSSPSQSSSSLASSPSGQGSLPLQRVIVEDGQPTVELGELELAPVHTLAGRIELTDGAPVPGPLQLLISREGAWDSQTATIQSDGAFRFENVPNSEAITFIAHVTGYQLATSRNHFQQLNENSLAMFVEAPREDLVIYYEPVPPKK